MFILPRGLIIGALISAPMGPIGMLVIQRTLSKGRWQALFTGIGAALSDLIYCLLTGFCLSFVTDIIDSHKLIIQIAGSVVLALFGIFTFRKNPTRQLRTAEVNANSYWRDFGSGFLFTFSNPAIIFFIIGLFARFTFLQPEFEIVHYVVAYAAICAGALGWWYLVTDLVSRLRKRINLRSLRLINRIVGIILMLMALMGVIVSIYDALRQTL